MDEPLSNLDAQLRVSMRSEIIKLHQRIRSTTVYVTHDQVEALTMGSRIAVLKDGRLMQVDTADNLYERPKSVFVATLHRQPGDEHPGGKSSRPATALPGCAPARRWWPIPARSARPAGLADKFGIRPEHLTLGARPGRAIQRP